MVYIAHDGVLYCLTRTQHKKLLRHLAGGGELQVGKFGQQLGHLTPVGDLTPDQARELLTRAA